MLALLKVEPWVGFPFLSFESSSLKFTRNPIEYIESTEPSQNFTWNDVNNKSVGVSPWLNFIENNFEEKWALTRVATTQVSSQTMNYNDLEKRVKRKTFCQRQKLIVQLLLTIRQHANFASEFPYSSCFTIIGNGLPTFQFFFVVK